MAQPCHAIRWRLRCPADDGPARPASDGDEQHVTVAGGDALVATIPEAPERAWLLEAESRTSNSAVNEDASLGRCIPWRLRCARGAAWKAESRTGEPSRKTAAQLVAGGRPGKERAARHERSSDWGRGAAGSPDPCRLQIPNLYLVLTSGPEHVYIPKLECVYSQASATVLSLSCE